MDEHSHDILEWDGPAIGLMDLDAFFASVEQLDHPEWRGLPVIVGGSADHRGVVSTASYEARRYGVHSAMPSAQARRLCPNAIWTHGNFTRYREVSAAVMGILSAETPRVEQVSIDEAFFDVTPGRFSRESPLEICRRIQARVSALGVSCSIGLGINKTVAKIASDRDKPRGLTVVFPGTEEAFLAPLPVSTMSGVGPATEKRLVAMGIQVLGDLAKASPVKLERTFGVMGPRMAVRAAGLERSVVAERAKPEEAKSVSNERTFDHDLTTGDEVRAAILHISSMTGRRLRRRGLTGGTVTLKLRYADLHVRTAQRQLSSPTNDEHVFGPVAVRLLEGLWQEGTPVRLVGVGISDFSGAHGRQMGLFDEAAAEDGHAHDHAALSQLTDALRDRFGDDAVSYGRDLRFKDRTTGTAPMGKNDD